MTNISTTHPGNYTLVNTTIVLDHPDLLPLISWEGRSIRPRQAIITWRWTADAGWTFYSIRVEGPFLRKDGTPGTRISFASAHTTKPDQWPLPPEYRALVEANRPHAWTPLPAVNGCIGCGATESIADQYDQELGRVVPLCAACHHETVTGT